MSKKDSLVLSGSDRILDSLKWKNFKSWNGASAFDIEVNHYHGFPKNETILIDKNLPLIVYRRKQN